MAASVLKTCVYFQCSVYLMHVIGQASKHILSYCILYCVDERVNDKCRTHLEQQRLVMQK